MKNLDLIIIDGAAGEGGGQILRSSLALSLVTGKPFRITGIRKGRAKPGLGRQHLTAVRAAAEVGNAQVMGDEIGSTDLTFVPRGIQAGQYRFAVGTAGSATLVLQTVLPALLTAAEPSNLVLEGGTHNRAAPPFEFVEQAYLPQINRMGPTVTAKLERPGFEPAGGGKFTVAVQPCAQLQPLELCERGEVEAKEIRAVVAHLDESIGRREVNAVLRRLEWTDTEPTVERSDNAPCTGNIVLVTVRLKETVEVTAGFGRLRARASKVGNEAGIAMKLFLESGAAVGCHLADQLLLPLALAGGGGFTTPPLSNHSRTQIATIKKFLPVDVVVTERDRHLFEVHIESRNEKESEEIAK
jgi:RNA 3'-terminal phosphate cyclase (ATP)